MNLADQYAEARVPTSPEALGLRQQSISRIARDDRSSVQILSLVQRYFALPGSDLAWLVEQIRQEDPTFSLIASAREADLLSASILNELIQEKSSVAMHAVVTATAMGTRSPTIAPWLLTNARTVVAQEAVDDRKARISGVPAASFQKIADEIGQLSEDIEVQKAVLTKMRGEMSNVVKALTKHVQTLAHQTHTAVSRSREESAMLWWVFAEWSDLLQMPFKDIGTASASLLAGYELAELTTSPLGPVSVPGLIQRILATTKKERGAISLSTAVTGGAKLDALPSPMTPVPETIAIIHSALHRARTVGDGWQAAFQTDTGFDPQAAASPQDLALQFYRERLLTVLADD